MEIDKSEITERELQRYGINELDFSIIHRFIGLLDKRIKLRDEEYTTMSDTKWIEHFRKALADHCDKRQYLQ
jgi:hypothetical protein